jgi:5-methylcytosine-specific restriction endonuclease McrA
MKAVAYKGGKCVKCGYNKSLSALQFHHTNPLEKDFGIGDNINRPWDSIKNELDKCILLCGNCHSEEHSKQKDEKLISYINNG